MGEKNPYPKPGAENAVVLAMFGTSVEQALPGLLNIRNSMAARFPDASVHMAFTSSAIRKIWRQRAQDAGYLHSRPDIPGEILAIQSPRRVIAGLHAAGYRSLVVQSVHMTAGDEFADLCRSVASLRDKDRSFRALAVGRPALGNPSDSRHPQHRDLEMAAASLADDVELARRRKAALVYLGHGSKSMAEKNIYMDCAAEMRRQYPDIPINMITIEGASRIEEVIAGLHRRRVGTVLLKPFLIAAGGHVIRDMLGGHPQSAKSRLEAAGFAVRPLVQGLGEQERFARIFVRHAHEAAQDAAIVLR